MPTTVKILTHLISRYHLPLKKIYKLKEYQAFSLELDRREKVARHPAADLLLHYVGGGGDFVDTVIAVKML